MTVAEANANAVAGANATSVADRKPPFLVDYPLKAGDRAQQLVQASMMELQP